MAAAGMSNDEYKWKWDYRVRELFKSVTGYVGGQGAAAPRALTDPEIVAYAVQKELIDSDIRDKARTPLTFNLLKTRVAPLATAFGVANPNTRIPAIPTGQGSRAAKSALLDDIYPSANIPTNAQIVTARGPGAQLQQPRAAPTPNRPIGIPEPQPVANAVTITNIILAADPPSIYEAITETDIPNLTREIKDPDFNSEQKFLVAIGDPTNQQAPAVPVAPAPLPIAAGTWPINIELTPLQYAALKGLKGIVRFLLNNTKSNISTPINENKLSDAVTTYRQNDSDKNEIEYIFKIVETAIRDAREDFTDGVAKDTSYGNSLSKEINKKLAKKYYTEEYDSLGAIGPASVTSKQTTPELIRTAKTKAKEDAEAGTPKNINYSTVPVVNTAYGTEYDKVASEKSSRTTTTSLSVASTKGKEDGSKGIDVDPDYTTGAVPPKPAGEIEAYGKEYDKAFAAYKGEQDGVLGEISDITELSKNLSEQYNNQNATQTYKDSINKIYEDAYKANQSKTSDLLKESGYVGTYPVNESVLSGNYFGFGPELNKILGFDASDSKPVESDTSYHEGFAEFVKNFRSLVGQAKYSGYTDGKTKNAKYTTPGKITIKGKDYSVDFGKLNVQLDKQIVDGSGNIAENPDYSSAKSILNDLKVMLNSDLRSLPSMIAYLKTVLEDNTISQPIKDALSSFVTSQRGGVETVYQMIVRKINEELKDLTGTEVTNLANKFSQKYRHAGKNNELLFFQTLRIYLKLYGLEIKEPERTTLLDKIYRIKSINEAYDLVQPYNDKLPDVLKNYLKRLKNEEDDKIDIQNQLAALPITIPGTTSSNAAATPPTPIASPPTPIVTPPTPVVTPIPATPVATPVTTPVPATPVPTGPIPDPLRDQKNAIKLKIDRLNDGQKNTFTAEINSATANTLPQIETDVDTAIAAAKQSIQTKIDRLSPGTRKTAFTDRLNNSLDKFEDIDKDIEIVLPLIDSINTITDNGVKAGFITRVNDLSEDVGKVKKEVDKAIFKQTKTINDKKGLIRKDIAKVTDVNIKTLFSNRVDDPVTDLEQLNTDVKNELLREIVADKIEKIPDGAVKTDFTTMLNDRAQNVVDLDHIIDSWLKIQKQIKNKIWYISDSVPEKQVFTTKVDDPNSTLDDLRQLENDIAPHIPSNLKILTDGFTTYIYKPVGTGLSFMTNSAIYGATALGTAASQKLSTLKTSASQGLSSLGASISQGTSAAASAIGTKATDVGASISQGTSALASAVGSKIYPLLGAVQTKSQLYNKIYQVLSKFPKYKYVKIDKSALSGKDPADPELPLTVSVTKRLQSIYDKEFQRGTKESLRGKGGTRRRTKKTDRVTKKNRSSKK